MPHPQLGLSLGLRDDARFDNFHAGSEQNRLVVDALTTSLGQPGPQTLFLHGAAGSGCSHLLQALCHAAAGRQLAAMYIPLDQLHDAPPADMLGGLEGLDAVCLDHLQAVAGQPAWEEALFHAMNRLRDAGRLLVMAASQPPADLPVKLPDLRTRLGAATVFRVASLDDDQRLALLRKRATERGLALDEDTARFLLLRAPRSTGELMAVLNTLDQEALAQQRRLTVPFIKSVMGW